MHLTRVPGIGPKTAAALALSGITAAEDLLKIVPRRYLDRREITTVAALAEGGPFNVRVVVQGCRSTRGFGARRAMGRVRLADETGCVDAVFFGPIAKGLASSFKTGRRVQISGILRATREGLEFQHPDYAFFDDEGPSPPRYTPVYPAVAGVPPKKLRSLILSALDTLAPRLIDAFPASDLGCAQYPGLVDALRTIHAPGDDADPLELGERRSLAHERMAMDELFFLQIGLMLRRRGTAGHCGYRIAIEDNLIRRVSREVGFDLTPDQSAVLKEVANDLLSTRPMHRLVQGDVGAGKTVVAMMAAIATAAAGYQVAVMAPTEVLATQHADRWRPIFAEFGIASALLVGSLPSRAAADVRTAIERGEIGIAIGTRALLSDRVRFPRLALLVVDEQHRFGVEQRARLTAADKTVPHLLVMSATPIPRTLALTIYGDLDVSVIRHRPPGRVGVRTVCVGGDRDRAYEMSREAIARGERVFVVLPTIEADEESGMSAVVQFHRDEAAHRFPGCEIGLLHGKLSAIEKEAAIRDFEQGRTTVLVSTTVIEVGVDVAEAGVMVVEQAERFGLSQLHQLRGRVGRSDRRGLCLLTTGPHLGENARRRLQMLEETDDGFEIAEEDLAIRGPGDILGVRQHGLPALRWACLTRDPALLERARAAARQWLDKDPGLTAEPAMARVLFRRWGRFPQIGTVG